MRHIFHLLRLYGPVRFTSFALSELKAMIWDRVIRKTYSQSGEDLIIDKLLGYKRKGMYIDIGAFDPKRFSNTMRFYLRGWQGVNIEPDTEHWKNFVRQRPRDINLNIGIGKDKGFLVFHEFNPPTLSTFSKEFSKQYIQEGFELLGKRKIQVLGLKDVFKKHVIHRHIDFLSVDVEGYEMEVLSSNDWKKYRPMVLCVELSFYEENSKEETARKLRLKKYILNQGYKIVAQTPHNTLFYDTKAKKQK